MTKEAPQVEVIKLPNVRISYPNIFRKGSYEGTENSKYDCTFILDKTKNEKLIKDVSNHIKKLLKDKNKGARLAADRYCLRDGDATGKEEYKNTYILKASSTARPTVMDRDKSPITEDDNVIYSGCRVNATIDLWFQPSHGKRVNANLRGIQFYRDDEAFGGGRIDPEIVMDEFEDLSGDEMSGDLTDDTPLDESDPLA